LTFFLLYPLEHRPSLIKVNPTDPQKMVTHFLNFSKVLFRKTPFVFGIIPKNLKVKEEEKT